MIEVLPFPMIRRVNQLPEGAGKQVDGDPLKLFGFDGLERRDDPPDARPSPPKHHIFEFCNFGEVKRRRLRYAYVHER